MNAFLRGSAPLGATSASNNCSVLYNRSGQFSPNASFANSSSLRQHSSSASPPVETCTPLLTPAPAPSASVVAASTATTTGAEEAAFVVSSPAAASMTGESSRDAMEAENATPLTVIAVKRYVRQLRQVEDREADRRSRQADCTAVSGGHRTNTHGEPSGQEPPSTTVNASTPQELGEDTDSEELDIYTARTERQVRAFLDEINDEDFTANPAPIPESIEDDLAGQQRREKERLKALSHDELRAIALDLHREFVLTLYDAVTLETNLTETDEDAAVLERALGDREERLELLKAQMNIVMDENVDLLDAKRDALRKLTEAKTEMALLSQRNSKLAKQLDLKEEEFQMSLTTSLNGSQRTSLTPAERRDTYTMTEVVTVRKDPHERSGSASASGNGNASHAAMLGESPLSLSHRSKSNELQHELEETQDELKLVRKTLCETEAQRIQLQEQLQELREATMNGFQRHSSNSRSDYDAQEQQRKDEEHGAALRELEERCERSAQHAASLEKDLGQVRAELQALKAKVAEEEKDRAAAVTAASESTVAATEASSHPLRVAPSSGAATPADSTSPARPGESREPSVEPTPVAASTAATAQGATGAHPTAASASPEARTDAPEDAARLSLSQPRSVSMEAQMMVLHRQLARAQSDAARLEQELRSEREKTQRQNQQEKRLLENVALLTRQLRARETLEREARLLRRSEANTARGAEAGEGGVPEGAGGDASAPVSEPRRSRFSTARSHLNDAASPSDGTAGAADGAAEEGDGSGRRTNQTGTLASAHRREHRATTPELGRRRESLFAALRSLKKSTEERRHSAPDVHNASITSASAESAADALTTRTPPREALRLSQPEPHPQVPIASQEEPQMLLQRTKAVTATPPTTTTTTTTSTNVGANAMGSTPAASVEVPSNSASSYRVSRLSVTSLVSPRGPRSSSLAAGARDASADCVRVEGGPHSTSVTAETSAAVTAAAGTTPQRHSVAKEPVTASRSEDLGASRKADHAAKQIITSVPALSSTPAVTGAATTASRKASASTDSTPFVLPEAITTPAQSPQHHVSRGQSCVRGSSSARPLGGRSSSVGAGVHRGSLSLSIPSTSTTTNNYAAASPSNNSNNATAAATKGATIVRGLAATTSGSGGAPRKRTASRRIVTGRDAKGTTSHDGSTVVLR